MLVVPTVGVGLTVRVAVRSGVSRTLLRISGIFSLAGPLGCSGLRLGRPEWRESALRSREMAYIRVEMDLLGVNQPQIAGTLV